MQWLFSGMARHLVAPGGGFHSSLPGRGSRFQTARALCPFLEWQPNGWATTRAFQVGFPGFKRPGKPSDLRRALNGPHSGNLLSMRPGGIVDSTFPTMGHVCYAYKITPWLRNFSRNFSSKNNQRPVPGSSVGLSPVSGCQAVGNTDPCVIFFASRARQFQLRHHS